MIKRIINKVISSGLKKKLIRIKNSRRVNKFNEQVIRFKLPFWSVLSSFRAFSSLYYFLFSNKMSREAKAVLAGKQTHLKNVLSTNSLGSVFQLKRNIHRIEKGLIMRPRRKIFALDYIEETITNFEKLIYQQGIDKGLKEWSRDVLKEYFNVIEKKRLLIFTI